jgi:drug/metabolite transporter (DMT)-like permease
VPGASQTRAYVALLVIATLWGSYPATAKLALQDFPPFFLAAVRCTLASAFLVTLLLRSEPDSLRLITPAALRAFLVLALAGIWGSTQITYLGLYFTTASNAALLQTATPVVVAIAARFYLGERLAPLAWLGVALSATGVLLVITEGRLAAIRPSDLRSGDFITLVSLSGWSLYTVYGKRVLAHYSPTLATTGAYVVGTVLILITAAITAPVFSTPRLESAVAWAVVLYQGLLGAVAHVWWYRAVHVVGPSRAAIFLNLQPVIGVLLAALLLSEEIGPWHIIGGAFVLAGVALTTRQRQ